MPNFDAERDIELQQLANRLAEIRETAYEERRPMEGMEHCVTGKGLGPGRMPEKGWKPFSPGMTWGGFDQTTWFRMEAVVPKEFKGQCVVALIRSSTGSFSGNFDNLSAVGESLCYVDGAPRQGLDFNRDQVSLVKKAKGGERFQIALEAVPSTRHDAYHLFRYADIAMFHQDAWDFYWDCAVPLMVYRELDSNYAPARQLLELVQQAVRMVDLQHQGEAAYRASLGKAQRFLRQGLKRFETSYGMGRLILTGHSHIDTAWLWPLRETQRKCGRTFNTVLDLMDRYPEFHFSCSQPELYMFVKEHYPETWKRIKQRVKEGRWEPCGAGWVEQDSNVPSGEALVRQFLYGNRFYREEFGMQSRTAWLPDAFGYPWSLPQILTKAQVDTFVTTKISWNEFTKFPYGMFQWQGIDGTRIFSVMPPLNYNGNPTPHDCIEQWKQFQQKERVEEVPFSIGWGDGGGGPTAEMIEMGRRMKNIVGVPKCEFGRTQDSLDRMRKQCGGMEPLPVYNDELYLELHRACQTTQARTKRNNRKSELLLRDAEFLSTLAMLGGGDYEQETLWKAWRVVLTSQFHDILPGSSITEVYDQADKDYAALQAVVRDVRDRAVARVVKDIDTEGKGTPVVVFNTLSWTRWRVVEATLDLPRGAFHVTASDGSVVPSQKVGPNTVVFSALMPPLGHAVYHVVPGKAEADTDLLKVTEKLLENDCLRIRLDGNGCFTSVYDKAEEREVLPKGMKGNVLQLFDDRPFAHDAWDIDHNFEDERTWEPGKGSVKVVESGPVRAVVRVVRKTERSTITQNITLCAGSPRVDVSTHVDWHEKRTLLKVAFPVDILSPKASYHIQYGAIERPTHHNDARDRARFEVTGQHWADLSEGDYGVSLLNDCKYGYDVKDNVLRLSLLRAPVSPDPEADQGEHDMTWSLFPHPGDWRWGTVSEGFELNVPLLAVPVEGKAGTRPAVCSFAAVDANNVVLDNVKKHEDSNAVIVRLYEAHGQRGNVDITFADTPVSVAECDLMEENDVKVKVKGNTVTLFFKPYEIRTLKLVF